jgi:hypothetical protein
METPKVYIAGPFFNDPQREIIARIEDLLTSMSIGFYSPRLHSGSADFTPEQRKDPKCWQRIYESNVKQMHVCGIVLAVIEYALPPNCGLYSIGNYEPVPPLVIRKDLPGGRERVTTFTAQTFGRVEIPDLGTAWEMGYARGWNGALSIVGQPGEHRYLPVVAFHTFKPPAELNLMLAHGCDGILTGWDAMHGFLSPTLPASPERQRTADRMYQRGCPWSVARSFDWSVPQVYAGEIE